MSKKVQRKLDFVISTPAKSVLARERVITPSSTLSKDEHEKRSKKKVAKVYTAGLAKLRLRQFPHDYLEEPHHNNTLFCRCCGKPLELKKSTVETHLLSALHINNKEKYKVSKERDVSILDYFSGQEKRYNGDTLPKELIKGRMRILRVMMLSGIALYKLDDEVSGLKDVLQLGNYNISYSAMRDLIPFMRNYESVRTGLLYLTTHIRALLRVPNIMLLLEAEYNLYRHLAVTAPQDSTCDILPWWQGTRNTLPSWHLLLEQAVLLHPNSAGAERVFALYKTLFGDEQQALLEDYKETAVMMRYNEIQRYKDRQNVYIVV